MRDPVVAIIPARYASTRFPGKPLVALAGVPMIVRVARRAQLAGRVDRVLIATDDARIAAVAAEAGFQAVMTAASCPSGTDRVAEAARSDSYARAAALIVNVQGDEPLIDPADIDVLIAETLASGAELGTLARPLEHRFDDPNVVKVVVGSSDHRALYFSRAAIPHGDGPRLQHIGLYAYRPEALQRLSTLAPTPLERVERLEQLRALEHGLRIHVAMARSRAPAVAIDTPEDVERVLALIGDEGAGPPS